MTVAVIVTAAVIAAVIGNAEYAVHRADGAADAGSDRSANGAADRTGNPVAFIRALLRAAYDALRMPDMGDREQRERECRTRKIKPRGRTGWQRRCSDFGVFILFISFLMAGSIGPAGWTYVTPL